MMEMSNKKDFVLELRAQELGLDINNLAQGLEREFQEAVAQTATAAYAKIVASAQLKLGSLSQEYLKGLDFQKIGKNQYLIILEGKFSNSLEQGIPSHDMKKTMLASKALVSEGSRAGQPWVQNAKDGHKYAYVPFPKNPFSKASPEIARVGNIIKGFTAQNRATGMSQKITSVFKDGQGNPLEGNVASVSGHGLKDLENLVKYQKVQRNEKSGKKTVQSVYMTFRTISENSPAGKWMHPGRDGLRAFAEAEAIVAKELDNILRYFLG
jgi:hypothetical protein